MKNLIKKILFFSLTVILISALCIFFYYFNNKYTKKSVQAFNGLLVLSESDLEEPLYLIDGWAFYPDILLTPEDFSRGNTEHYMIYTNIGESTQFINYSQPESPHGRGTYLLYLYFPDHPDTYTLDLPEIFSAYRLYLNDSLILQMGDPNPENYQSCTQNRSVTFEASGQVRLLIAVSDYSHFYSGIIYPPAIGTPQSLTAMQTIRYGLSVAVITLGIIIALLSLYLGIRMKNSNALFFFLLCISMCGFSSYNVLHTLFALPIFPYYALELISGYLMAFFTVLLHGRICRIHRLVQRLFCGIIGFFCILALFYGLCASQLTISTIQIFSKLVFLFKAAVAGYLLVTAWLFFDRRSKSRQPLFYASIIYAVFFIWDRIFPNYEPIYGGWYSEWGSFIMVITIGYILWRDMVSTYSYGLVFAKEHYQITRQLSMQTAYMKKLSSQISENRKAVHDFRQHLHTITSIAQQLSTNEHQEPMLNKLLTYLETLSSQQFSQHSLVHHPFCKNIAVDSLLQYYYAAAIENGFKVNFQLTLPDSLALSDVELCTVLGNLLENALYACHRDTADNRSIILSSRETKSQLFICVENTYDGKFKEKEKRYLSLKSTEDRFGIGLESIRETIERYGGVVSIRPMDHSFRVGIIIPLHSK